MRERRSNKDLQKLMIIYSVGMLRIILAFE